MFPQPALIAFLLPLGLWLNLLATANRSLEPRAAATGLITLTVSALVYLAIGFGIMFGGVGVLNGQRQFAEMSAYFALPVDGSVWAIAGMKGFFLDGVTSGRVLFVAWLPLAQACAMLVAVPLWRRYSLLAVGVAAALATLAFSVIGMATWGGGLGASMANQLRLGHGPIDFSGLGISGVIAGTFSLLVARLRSGSAPTLHEAPHPLRAAMGFGLAFIGAASALAANPFVETPQTAASDYAIVIVAATAVAGLLSLAFTVFVSKRPNIETVTASMLAALIAVSAGAMSLPIWAAALLGFVSAVSVIVGGFVWKANVDSGDSGLGVPRMLIPAAAGLLAAGIATTGLYGAGVNGIGTEVYLGTRGLGVTGLIGAAGGIADPGQATAQIVLLILCASVAAVIGLPLRVFAVSTALIETTPEKVAVDTPVEAPARASAVETPLGVAGEPLPQPIAVEPALPFGAPPPVPILTVAPSAVTASANPVTPSVQASAPPKHTPPTAAQQPAPAGAPTPGPAIRAPNLLERLRGNRPVEKPKPVGQARRVAYPVRVGGRRLILRAMPTESKPPEDAKDADAP